MGEVNTLRFKVIDPVEAGEHWTDVQETNSFAVEIYIDDKEILDIIRPVEAPFMKAEGLDLKPGDDYGHVRPQDLYKDLIEATTSDSFSHDYGVYLCCCGGCGEPGCWSVTAKVKEEDDNVIWYDFKHEHRDWEYDLEFRFENQQ